MRTSTTQTPYLRTTRTTCSRHPRCQGGNSRRAATRPDSARRVRSPPLSPQSVVCACACDGGFMGGFGVAKNGRSRAWRKAGKRREKESSTRQGCFALSTKQNMSPTRLLQMWREGATQKCRKEICPHQHISKAHLLGQGFLALRLYPYCRPALPSRHVLDVPSALIKPNRRVGHVRADLKRFWRVRVAHIRWSCALRLMR